jgi:hypothetical protein
MTISRRHDGNLITTTDPTASALRTVLRSDLTTILASERNREIESFVRRERALANAAGVAPFNRMRRSRGLRRAIATALLGLARRFADDVIEPARPAYSTTAE